MNHWIQNWFFEIRKKIKKKELDFFQLTSEIDQLAFKLLQENIIYKIQTGFFDNKFTLERNIVQIGNLKIGHKQTIVAQAMAIGNLRNIDQLWEEFKDLVDNGAEIIRIAVTGIEDAMGMEHLKQKMQNTKYDQIPIVMCGQYNVAPIIKKTNILNYIDKLRINPGNISLNQKNENNFIDTIEYLVKYNNELIEKNRAKIAVRIGVNWGSLDEKLKIRIMDFNAQLGNYSLDSSTVEQISLALSAISSGLLAEMIGLDHNLIVVSCKTSETESAYIVNKLLAMLCDYSIHLGITEAGQGEEGIILSACGLSPILREKIGNTVRVSITPRINQKRSQEIIICKKILQAVGARQFKPKITSCPGCGRTDSTYFRVLAEKVQNFIEENLEQWCIQYNNQKIRHLKVAVMGCLVNGPGESKHADIGISLPGFRESHSVVVYLDGEKYCTLKGELIEQEFFEIITNYVARKFGKSKESL